MRSTGAWDFNHRNKRSRYLPAIILQNKEYYTYPERVQGQDWLYYRHHMRGSIEVINMENRNKESDWMNELGSMSKGIRETSQKYQYRKSFRERGLLKRFQDHLLNQSTQVMYSKWMKAGTQAEDHLTAIETDGSVCLFLFLHKTQVIK